MHFSGDVKDGQKVCENVITITNRKRRQVKTTARYLFTPVGMAMIQTTKETSIGKGVEERESLYTICRNLDLCRHYGK